MKVFWLIARIRWRADSDRILNFLHSWRWKVSCSSTWQSVGIQCLPNERSSLPVRCHILADLVDIKRHVQFEWRAHNVEHICLSCGSGSEHSPPTNSRLMRCISSDRTRGKSGCRLRFVALPSSPRRSGSKQSHKYLVWEPSLICLN